MLLETYTQTVKVDRTTKILNRTDVYSITRKEGIGNKDNVVLTIIYIDFVYGITR